MPNSQSQTDSAVWCLQPLWTSSIDPLIAQAGPRAVWKIPHDELFLHALESWWKPAGSTAWCNQHKNTPDVIQADQTWLVLCVYFPSQYLFFAFVGPTRWSPSHDNQQSAQLNCGTVSTASEKRVTLPAYKTLCNYLERSLSDDPCHAQVTLDKKPC